MYCSWYILVYTGLSLGCMYCSWYILGCHWDVCIVAGIYWAVLYVCIYWYILGCMYCSWYILGCHWDVCIVAGIYWDVCIVAGIYWAVTGMYVL